MVNRYSASASEIFAAAMQDYGRAIIVGENTYGKGTVQHHRSLQMYPFDNYENPLGSVQFTVAKFYRMNGGSTQMRGVVPDFTFPSAIDMEAFGESSLENALPWDQIPALDYSSYNAVGAVDWTEWQERLNQQIQSNLEFQFILEDFDQYLAEKDNTWVSLVLAERKAEQAEEEAKKLARANARLKLKGLEPVEKIEDIPTDIELDDPYLKELVQISFALIDAQRIAMNQR